MPGKPIPAALPHAALLLLAALLPGCTWLGVRPVTAVRTVLQLTPSASHPGATDFVQAMDKLTGTQPVGGNAVQLLTNGGQAFPAMLRAIAQAESRISIQTYIIRFDRIGQRFVEHLTAAAQRGVEVRFLFDHVGAQGATEADLAGLLAAGGQVRVFNPLTNWTVTRANNRNHRKLLVVDGKHAFMGGLNLAADYDGDGRTGWRDTALRVTGPAALAAERVFASSWQQGGRAFFGKDLPVIGLNQIKQKLDQPFLQILHRPAPFNPPAPADHSSGGVPVRVVASTPDQVSSHILDMYLLAIGSARQRVWITQGYFLPPRLLRRALVHAARRGVDVRLILPGPTDEATVKRLGEAEYGPLLKAGIKLYEYQPSVLHAKTMMVDNRWCTIGSANLDGRALNLNYEANFAVDSTDLAAAMARQFRRDLEASQPVTLDILRQRLSLPRRIGDYLLYPVRGQF